MFLPETIAICVMFVVCRGLRSKALVLVGRMQLVIFVVFEETLFSFLALIAVLYLIVVLVEANFEVSKTLYVKAFWVCVFAGPQFFGLEVPKSLF